MTAKEKAKELTKKTIAKINGWSSSWADNKTIEQVKFDVGRSWFKARDINLFFINEIIEELKQIPESLVIPHHIKYWQEVKTELEKL